MRPVYIIFDEKQKKALVSYGFDGTRPYKHYEWGNTKASIFFTREEAEEERKSILGSRNLNEISIYKYVYEASK